MVTEQAGDPQAQRPLSQGSRQHAPGLLFPPYSEANTKNSMGLR